MTYSVSRFLYLASIHEIRPDMDLADYCRIVQQLDVSFWGYLCQWPIPLKKIKYTGVINKYSKT